MANAPAPIKIYDEGVLVYSGKKLDFVGAAVAVTNVAGKAVITITASGGVTAHSALTGLSVDDHTQYHTDARALTWLGTRSTSDLAEGTNLYYTAARFNSAFSAKSTTDLAEGTNLYYTAARFNSAFSAKSTTDLSEGTNLYYTDARARAAISATSPISYSAGVITTSMATNKLIGRSTASSGVMEEIAIGTGLSLNAGTLTNTQTQQTSPAGISLDGGGVSIGTGEKNSVVCPFAGTIVGYDIIADAVGSIVVDVWKINNAVPTVSHTITASAKPTLSSAQLVESSTLTGWTTSVAAGDVFKFNVDSCSTITKATLTLRILRS